MDPYANPYMQSHYYNPVFQPLRSRPAEYCRPPYLGYPGYWMKDGNIIPVKNKDKKYSMVWPKDGKNGNAWGRLKDIATGKGPDMFVTVGAHRADPMFHRPRTSRWAVHRDLDDRGPDCFIGHAPWAGRRDGRREGYNFQSREYGPKSRSMWTGAVWADAPNSKQLFPDQFRDWRGLWWDSSNARTQGR